MSEPPITFITYTKGAVQFVTTPRHETDFLNWLHKVGGSSTAYVRETNSQVAVRCCPTQVHSAEKKEAVVLTLVKKDPA